MSEDLLACLKGQFGPGPWSRGAQLVSSGNVLLADAEGDRLEAVVRDGYRCNVRLQCQDSEVVGFCSC